MKSLTTLIYCKLRNRYTYRARLEREHGDQEIEVSDISSEITEQLENIMRQEVFGKITITIEISD